MKQNEYPDMHMPQSTACIPQETVITDVQLAQGVCTDA